MYHFKCVRKLNGLRGLTCVVIGTVYVITFCVILPVLLNDTPYSVYNIQHPRANENKATPHHLSIEARMAETNKQRYDESLKYLKNLQPAEHILLRHIPYDVIVAVITASRKRKQKEMGFLTQVVMHIERYMRTTPLKVGMLICNIDQNPFNHTEVQKLRPFFTVYNKYVKESEKAKARRNRHNVYEKEKDDYVSCARQALQYNTHYVLMQEDDALPHSNFFYIVGELIKNYKSYSWDYVKLYYKSKWSGYSKTLPHVIELLYIGFAGATTCTLTLLIWLNLYLAKTSQNRNGLRCFHSFPVFSKHTFAIQNKYLILLIWSAAYVYFILLALTIGRQTILELKKAVLPKWYSLSQAPGGSTASIIYTTHTLEVVSNYLDKVTCTNTYAVDVALNAFHTERNLNAYLVEPYPVQHIGFVSSIKGFRNDVIEFELYNLLNRRTKLIKD